MSCRGASTGRRASRGCHARRARGTPDDPPVCGGGHVWCAVREVGTMTSMMGALVTETFEYDGGRQVTVYIPPDRPEAVVYAADGQLIAPWGAALEAADVPSTMIVGVHRLADEMMRLHEYSPGFDAERFAAHEKFFVEDVGGWARRRFGVA